MEARLLPSQCPLPFGVGTSTGRCLNLLNIIFLHSKLKGGRAEKANGRWNPKAPRVDNSVTVTNAVVTSNVLNSVRRRRDLGDDCVAILIQSPTDPVTLVTQIFHLFPDHGHSEHRSLIFWYQLRLVCLRSLLRKDYDSRGVRSSPIHLLIPKLSKLTGIRFFLSPILLQIA
jgi:hypothetical protein